MRITVSRWFGAVSVVSVALLATGCAQQSATDYGAPTNGGVEGGSLAAITAETPQEELVHIRAELAQVKGDLAEEGVYGCCIRPGCDFCPLAVEKCPCAGNLVKGEGVCGQCKAGWIGGHGQLEGVNADDVQIAPAEMMKMMYDMLQQKVDEATGGI